MNIEILTIENFAAACSLLAVWNLRKQLIWYWPLNLINSIAYFFVFMNKGIYAQMALQVIYVIICIVGFYKWSKQIDHEKSVQPERMIKEFLFKIIGAGFGLSILLYFVLVKFTNSQVPVLDALTSSFSLLGTWLFTKRYLETWLIWIVVDIVGIVLYLYRGLYTTAILYGIFIFMAVQGYYMWKREFQKN